MNQTLKNQSNAIQAQNENTMNYNLITMNK